MIQQLRSHVAVAMVVVDVSICLQLGPFVLFSSGKLNELVKLSMSNRMVFSSIRMPSSISYKSGKLLSLLRKTFSSVRNVSLPHLTSIRLCDIMTNKTSGVLIVCMKSPTKENSDNTFWITADRFMLMFCSSMCRKIVDVDTPTWSSKLWNNKVSSLSFT